MTRTNETIVRVVHNGFNLGLMTWGKAKELAVKYNAKLKKGNQKSDPVVWQIVGGDVKPKG